jgi:UDP-N-acetylglucosamine transferase subunit ALG13
MTEPATDSVAGTPLLPPGSFIFVSVGTDHHPFDRLIDVAEAWAARTEFGCFIQTGASRTATTTPGSAYLPYESMVEAMRTAAAVVCHGGPATIMLARQCGRIPIVMPRDPDRGEHVDGHQIEFCRWMAAKGQIVLAESAPDLEVHLAAALSDPDRYRTSGDEDETARAVRRFSELADELMDRKRPR